MWQKNGNGVKRELAERKADSRVMHRKVIKKWGGGFANTKKLTLPGNIKNR